MTWELALDPILAAVMGSIRVMMVFTAGPVFGHPSISPRFRAIFTILVVFAIGPEPAADAPWRSMGVVSLVAAVISEALIGYLIGFTSNIIFGTFLVLGQFVSYQGGLAMAKEVDPVSGVSTAAMGSVFNIFGALVFLIIGGHHDLLRAIALSFDRLQLGSAGLDMEVFPAVVSLASSIFEVGFRFAAPVTVAIFVENVAIGILGKAMPQLNLLMINMPIHIGMLFVIVGLGAPDMVHAFKDLLEVWPEQVAGVLYGAAP